MKVQHKDDEDYDEVISKFYYKIKFDTPSSAIIGIHQEDDRLAGSERRGFIDLGFAVLKQEDGDVNLYDFVQYKNEREVQKEIKFDVGSYIIIPLTLGALL